MWSYFGMTAYKIQAVSGYKHELIAVVVYQRKAE